MNSKRASKKPTKRAVGRPPREATQVREDLIDQALIVFAKEGIAHANLRRIALAARATPAMVHYHFGDKTGLMEAVFSERMLPVMSRIKHVLDDSSRPALERLHSMMRSMVQMAMQNPWAPRLMMREVYNQDGALRETVSRQFGRHLAHQLKLTLSEAKHDGTLNTDIPLESVVYAFLSLAIYPVLTMPLVPMMIGMAHDEAAMQQQADYHFRIFLKGIVG